MDAARLTERLSPDQVRETAFPLTRLGKRGFDEEHVRVFLAEVEQELLTLLSEKTSLANEVERLRKRIVSGATGQGGMPFRKEDAHAHAVRILSNAQLTADRYVADAQAYSRKLTDEARRRRDEILAQAHRHAEMVIEEASERDEAGLRPLQAEVAYLRVFGEVYLAHLRAYTEGVLRSIDEWELHEERS
jgi:DivIVA domain-containing protein